jgi:hypothetical protein
MALQGGGLVGAGGCEERSSSLAGPSLRQRKLPSEWTSWDRKWRSADTCTSAMMQNAAKISYTNFRVTSMLKKTSLS